MSLNLDIPMRIVLELIVGIAFSVVVFGNIFSKAGFSRWYSLAMAFPIINLVAIIWLAFTNWPIEDKLLEMEFDQSRGAVSKAEV